MRKNAGFFGVFLFLNKNLLNLEKWQDFFMCLARQETMIQLRKEQNEIGKDELKKF